MDNWLQPNQLCSTWKQYFPLEEQQWLSILSCLTWALNMACCYLGISSGSIGYLSWWSWLVPQNALSVVCLSMVPLNREPLDSLTWRMEVHWAWSDVANLFSLCLDLLQPATVEIIFLILFYLYAVPKCWNPRDFPLFLMWVFSCTMAAKGPPLTWPHPLVCGLTCSQ